MIRAVLLSGCRVRLVWVALTLPAMSCTASALNGTTSILVKNQINACRTKCSWVQRKPFVGDRFVHRYSSQGRAALRSHIVCITKVNEAEFQTEVLKVGPWPLRASNGL